MTYDNLIDRLAADLKPVRPRRTGWDVLIVGGICLAELVLFLAAGMARPDMPLEMTRASLWWRLGGLGILAVAAGSAALKSFAPTYWPKDRFRWIAAIAIVCLITGLAIDRVRDVSETIIQQLNWTQGVQCAGKIILLSVPPLIGLGVLMRRGAPTAQKHTALLVGLAAAAWGAFVFVFACPFNNPLYIVVWYSVALGIVTGLSRVMLPRVTAW